MPTKKNTEKKEENSKFEYKRTNSYDLLKKSDEPKVKAFADEYMKFISDNKTERECVTSSEQMLKDAGFVEISKAMRSDKKVYRNFRGKNIFAAIRGKKSLKDGFRMIGAHIDSPRLDIKFMPLYDSEGIALLKTHYYGGIKKYQWVTIPLCMRGVIFTTDGNKLSVNIGDNPGDPIFFLSDILIHYARDQMSKKSENAVEGEEMNLLIGSRYTKDDKSPKKAILALLNKKYNIDEKSFLSAELQIVPAGEARYLGFDESMIAGYGHDDRACAYTALRGLLDVGNHLDHTGIVYFSDKEEIGSEGSTGAQSDAFEYFVQQLFELEGDYELIDIKKSFFNSYVLSGDVSPISDPTFKGTFDPMNVAKINHGTILEKFTGRGGKYFGNDADAEYMNALIRYFDSAGVNHQSATDGKIDLGGGGTIAGYSAALGMNVVDMGIGTLALHAPYEVISTIDLYHTYLAYLHFFKFPGIR